jgi:hypothetical protein
MNQYDSIFNSQETLADSLSPEEGVAAIAIITALSDAKVSDIDVDYLISLLWDTELFDDYSDEEMSEMIDQLFVLAKQGSLGALFNAAYDCLPDELLLDAYAVGVMMVIDESGTISAERRMYLKELQIGLELEDDEAQQIIDEVVTSFSEDEEYDEDVEEYDEDDEYDEDVEEYDENDENDVASDSVYVYESRSGNFTVAVPVDPEKGGKIDEQDGIVKFSDNFGRFVRIDYYPFSDLDLEKLESVGQEEYLRSTLVDDYVAQTIIPNVQHSKVEHTEYLEDEEAYFVVVDMPQGSTIYKEQNGEPPMRLDALRGLMSLIVDDFWYIISCQRTIAEGETLEPMEQEIEGLKDQLLDFIDTVEFT